MSQVFQTIPIAAIVTSPFNPRTVFEGLDELAASIEAQGLLENLVVRPGKKAGAFELVAGERRFRALKQLKWSEAPCRVIEADDGAAMAAQIVENLQRADIAPLEEAEAFKRLQDYDDKKWTAAAIAKAIGKTDRFVAQRLAIARNLAAPFKKQLEKGELTVEAARTLAALPQSVQPKLKDDWRVKRGDAKEIREVALQVMVPESTAAFDLSAYKGEIHEEGGKRYLADVEQFDKLQNAAAQSTVAKLREGLWKSAKIASEPSEYCWGDTLDRVSTWENKTKSRGKAKVGADQLTAIVWITRERKVRQATGVVPAAIANKARGRSSAGDPNRETAAERRSRMDFNARLVQGCASKPDDVGARVMLTALIAGFGARMTYDGNAVQRHADLFLPEALATIAKRGGNTGDVAKTWAIVKAMKLEAVHAALGGYSAHAFLWDRNRQGSRKKPAGFPGFLGAMLKVKPREVPATPKKKGAAK